MPLWKSIERFNQDPQTIVVVPSMSIDAINSGAVIQAYEERFLFLLLLLRQPRARLIYVTSRTILPSIIDYYLIFFRALSRAMRGSAFSCLRRWTVRCAR